MDNNVVTQQTEAPKKNFLIPFLIVLVLIAAVEMLLLLNESGKMPLAVSTVDNQEVTAPVQEGVAEGVISLSTANPDVSVGTPITFVVKLDSNSRGVVGMDAVVSYDKSVFTAGPVRSSMVGFTANYSSRKDYLEITSSKDPQTVEIPVLANTDVFSFTLTPRKAGIFKVELLSNADKSSTKFIDAETAIYLPKVNAVTVTVK